MSCLITFADFNLSHSADGYLGAYQSPPHPPGIAAVSNALKLWDKDFIALIGGASSGSYRTACSSVWCIHYSLTSLLRDGIGTGARDGVGEIHGSARTTHRRKLVESALVLLTDLSQ